MLKLVKKGQNISMIRGTLEQRKLKGASSTVHDIEEGLYRRVGKGRRCCLGDVFECRTSQLKARMIWRTVFGRTSILGGWWFGVVWTGRSFSFIIIHSAKCSFFYSSISANHHVAKSVLRQGTKSILSPKEQRRPLPSFLYKFFFYAELPAQGGPWSTPTTSWMPRFSTIKRPVKVRLLGAVMLRSTRPPWCKTGSRSSYFQLFCFICIFKMPSKPPCNKSGLCDKMTYRISSHVRHKILQGFDRNWPKNITRRLYKKHICPVLENDNCTLQMH